MKRIIFLSTLFMFSQISFATPEICTTTSHSDYVIKKSIYLAMPNYEKQSFLTNTFQVGEARGSGFIQHDNIIVSEAFRAFGKNQTEIHQKLVAAAQKAFKKYEQDTLENTTMLVAKVIYEADCTKPNDINPWAVLISNKTVTRTGQILLQPVSIYSIERNGSSEALVRIVSNLNGPLL
jgi:hypothetical protein